MFNFEKSFIFNEKDFDLFTMGELIVDMISDDYDDMKLQAYKLGSQKINQIVEEHWINKTEMDLYLAGGTSLNLNLDDDFIKLNDAQMATAIGLYEVAKIKF